MSKRDLLDTLLDINDVNQSNIFTWKEKLLFLLFGRKNVHIDHDESGYTRVVTRTLCGKTMICSMESVAYGA